MKKRREPPVEAEARAIFLSAVADATPISHDRVLQEAVPPLPIPRQRQLDEHAALQESLHGPALLDLHLEGGDEAAWLRTGLARSILRDLRRGRWVVQDHLDLHGSNREEARQLVTEFLANAMFRGLRCLRIVHGKGLGSPGREPILKKLVLGWLSQRSEVLAFCQARAAEGGAGAVVILLKSAK